VISGGRMYVHTVPRASVYTAFIVYFSRLYYTSQVTNVHQGKRWWGLFI